MASRTELQVNAANAALRRAGQTIPSTEPTFVHPDYKYWKYEWEACRDTFIGQKAIKDKAQYYLPKLSAQDNDQYLIYLQRAIFYNMVARTVNGLLGTIFRRDPKYINVPAGVDMAHVSRHQESMRTFLKRVAQEVLLVGRFGVLVDIDAATDTETKPYFCGYVAENILDWEYAVINGRQVLQSVLLREIESIKDGTFGPRRYRWRFRRLILAPIDMNTVSEFGDVYEIAKPVKRYSSRPGLSDEEVLTDFNGEDDNESPVDPDIRMVYQQWVYEVDPGKFQTEVNYAHKEPNYKIVPLNRGQPFEYIPFWFFGAHSNLADIEKPPLLDIVELNLSHYLSYAELQHGRFYTAQPIYFVPTSDTKGTYKVGPDTVWEVESGQKPGIIEYNGQGLRFLENALDKIEDEASAIGGRFMTQAARGAAESDNTLRLKEANERSLLINLVGVIDEGMTAAYRFWLVWQDIPPARAELSRIELNQDFLLLEAGAREFRAVASMWKEGQLPGEVVFEYFKRFEVIPDWMDYETFSRMMSDPEQFTLQVDALARMQGYPDAKTKVQIGENQKDRDLEEDLQDNEIDAQETMTENTASSQFTNNDDDNNANTQQSSVPPQFNNNNNNE